jgi:hypothetical protein
MIFTRSCWDGCGKRGDQIVRNREFNDDAGREEVGGRRYRYGLLTSEAS